MWRRGSRSASDQKIKAYERLLIMLRLSHLPVGDTWFAKGQK